MKGLQDKRLKKLAALCTMLVMLAGMTGALAESGMLVKNEESGAVSYSTDGGTTWTEGTPKGYHTETNEKGETLSWVGSAPAPGDDAFMVENENGTLRYSTDGGATWGDTLPEGMILKIHDDGSVSIQMESSDEAEGGMLVKNEEGIISHSTDGGETWITGAPEGFNTKTDESGGTLSWVGEAPAPGADSLMVRTENGSIQYSTDGGPCAF